MATRHQPLPAAPDPEAGTATADVHAHTTRSDGVLEPAELVAQAAAVGIRLFAIADHDNLAAFRELTSPSAAPLPPGLELVPATEINAVTRGSHLDLLDGELHVLGIGVDPSDAAFEAALAGQRAERRIRFDRTVERLREIGMPVDAQLAHLDRAADDALGRPTLARALMRAGFVDSVDDAFERVLSWGQPGYVPRSGLGPFEAVRAIRDAGGIASLAHFWEAPARRDVLHRLTDAGLDGLETHHRSFDAETRVATSALARELGLIETGGTDYHGDLGPYAESHAGLVMPPLLVERLRDAIAGTRWGRGRSSHGAAGATIAPR